MFNQVIHLNFVLLVYKLFIKIMIKQITLFFTFFLLFYSFIAAAQSISIADAQKKLDAIQQKGKGLFKVILIVIVKQITVTVIIFFILVITYNCLTYTYIWDEVFLFLLFPLFSKN